MLIEIFLKILSTPFYFAQKVSFISVDNLRSSSSAIFSPLRSFPYWFVFIQVPFLPRVSVFRYNFLSASHFRFNLIPQVEETKPENEETKKRSRGWKFEYFRLCNFFARCPFSQINPSVGFKIKRLFYFIHVIFHLLTTTFIILTITIITIKTLKWFRC